MKKSALLFAVICCSVSLYCQNLLPEKWKFKTGDDMQWASATYDDSRWDEIKAGIQWEPQGYNSYDGFAWYRVTITIPSTLKEVAQKYHGFNLFLGKIDDVDFTYFNGRLLAKTGQLPPEYVTKWDADRVYRVPVSWIKWDQPNVIAVRVFDLLGGGGIYGDPVQFSVRGLSDYLSIETDLTHTDQVFYGNDEVKLSLKIINKANKTIPGTITVHVVSDFGKEVITETRNLEIKEKSTAQASFPVPGIQPGFYRATVTFTSEVAFKKLAFGFGYEPEKIISPVDTLDGFTAFWARAKQELASVDPQFRMIRIDSLCTGKRTVYLVEMHSLGNVLIRGWYSVPAVPGRYPAIMQVPGYSGNQMWESVDYGDKIIGFALNIRGHGNSQDDVNPGFPGYLQYGLPDKETYIYRGAYMDCVRGIDFLFSRPEVDTLHVAVEGGSQGGALTFATSALDNNRIVACAPLVPFLSDFRDYFKVAAWPGNEFTEYVEKENKMTWDALFGTLSYFDIKNLAVWIRCPMFMGAGLVDDVCPPHINFAAYNQVKSPKQYVIYPKAGHGLPEDFYIRRMEFLNKSLGM